MAVNDDPNEREDHTKLIAGNEGLAVDQDPDTGELLAALTGNESLKIDQDPATGEIIAKLIGSEGIAIDQEAGTGKGLFRLGGEAAQADVDVGSRANPHDLAANDYESEQRDAGGAQYLAGQLESQQENAFSVSVEWLDDQGDITAVSAPDALQDIADGEAEFNLLMRSDKFNIVVTDTSGAADNDIVGTINAH